MGNIIYSLVLVFVMFTTWSEAGGVNGRLVYACYPNATLKIENPGGYQGVFANNTDTLCNTTFKNDKLHLYVTGCPLEVPISVTFSNYSGISSGMLGGKTDVESFVVTCNQLPASGVFRVVEASIGVEVLTSNQSTVYPLYNLTSVIYLLDYRLLVLFRVSAANVGQRLLWIIAIDEDGFFLRPELCIAYPGRNLSAVTNSTIRKRLTEIGCSVDKGLTSNFTRAGGVDNMVIADLYAFRFFESEYITIECDVRICPIGSTYCDIDCTGDRRKREVDSFDSVLTHIAVEMKVALNFSRKDWACFFTKSFVSMIQLNFMSAIIKLAFPGSRNQSGPSLITINLCYFSLPLLLWSEVNHTAFDNDLIPEMCDLLTSEISKPWVLAGLLSLAVLAYK